MRARTVRYHLYPALILGLTPRLASAALAQTPPASPAIAPAPAPLSVEEAVTRAIRQNPRLTAVAREIEAARRGVRSARALTNPSVTFTPGITSIGGSDEEFLLVQPLELNGTRTARTGIAQAQWERTRAESLVELRDLVFQTRTAYYELARTQELRGIAEELLRSAEEFDRGVRRQAEEGLRPGIDRVQTGIEVARAQQQVVLAESQVQAAQIALNTLLGQPTAAAPAVAPLTFQPEAVDRNTLLAQALEARAEIQAEAATREQFRAEARLARAQGRPDLAPQLRAGGVVRGVQNAGVGLGVTLPFLDYGSRRNRVRQAEQSVLAQEARIEASRNRVRQEVEQALTRLTVAEATARNYQGGVLEQSQRLLEGSMRALQIGAPGTTILTVLEAQRTRRTVRTEYTNALAQYAQARAELERAVGAVSADLLPQAKPEGRHEANQNPAKGGDR